MHSHALPLRELQRQELLAEAAHERQLDQLGPTAAPEHHDIWSGIAGLRQHITSTLASLRPALHLSSQATTN